MILPSEGLLCVEMEKRYVEVVVVVMVECSRIV